MLLNWGRPVMEYHNSSKIQFCRAGASKELNRNQENGVYSWRGGKHEFCQSLSAWCPAIEEVSLLQR